jgi:methylene-fatty-acyl-phospholipid synthase
MYDGSSLCFLSTALYKASPCGILLSILVYFEYKAACLYEEPFTAQIVSLSTL